MSLRLGKGKVSDVLRLLDEMTYEALAKTIAEDVKRVGVERFIKHLLYCAKLKCIAEAVIRADLERGDSSDR